MMNLLLHKVAGVQPPTLSCDLDQLIPTDDLYGKKESWEIFGDSEEKKLYFFTKLKKVGNNKKTISQRFLRNVGTDMWTNKGQKKNVYRAPGEIIGYRRCYRYERQKNDADDVADRHGIWLLHVKQEYKDYALCALKKKMSKKMETMFLESCCTAKTPPLPSSSSSSSHHPLLPRLVGPIPIPNQNREDHHQNKLFDEGERCADDFFDFESFPVSAAL